jgi:hypothetical protein
MNKDKNPYLSNKLFMKVFLNVSKSPIDISLNWICEERSR